MEAGSELVVSSPRAILTKEALKAESEQRQLLAQYIAKQMVEGTDFGKIPGTDKPTLLKPGAEKLTDLFRCTPKFHLVKIEEDFDKGFFNYVFRVRLYQRDADAVLAEGFGSANSREGRYRWREAQRKCPVCGKATIFLSKHAAEFYCWSKKGGCGAKFKDNDPGITAQVAGRVENDDIATLANTILKMAKKRALVDGAIALARCSDMFTQDVEDFADHQHHEPEPPKDQTGKKAAPADTSSKSVKPAAEPKPKAKPVVDVKEGETEAQATARAAAEQQKAAPATPAAQAPAAPTFYEQMQIAFDEYGVPRAGLGPLLEALMKKGVISNAKSKKKDLDAGDLASVRAELAKAQAAKEAVERKLNPQREPGEDDVPF